MCVCVVIGDKYENESVWGDFAGSWLYKFKSSRCRCRLIVSLSSPNALFFIIIIIIVQSEIDLFSVRSKAIG